MAQDLGLLFLRVTAPLIMAFTHGWPKIEKFSFLKDQFPDPIGLGSQLSLSLAIFGEVVAPLFIAAGLLTRLGAIPASITMAVAAFVHHANDPFAKQEMAILYLIIFVTLFLAGPGKFSLQHLFGLSSKSKSPILSWLLR
ncbi:MAG: DoxX family protein [Pseudobdellovibrionaceae bacterium]|nr:DoxX family protein [Bdellovibrionales bacterium]USN48657.1 MAG: DoxX family protein [Pseudobdellovibrionaceae bacterium]